MTAPRSAERIADEPWRFPPIWDAPHHLGPIFTDDWSRLRLSPGSIVVVIAASGIGLLRCVDSLIGRGLVPALVPPATPAGRLKAIVEDFGAAAVVFTAATEARAVTLQFDGSMRIGGHFIGFPPAPPASLATSGELILVTSGTSSDFSSGCVHTIDAIRRNARRHAAAIGLRAGDRMLIQLPLYYSFAFVAQAIAAAEIGADVFFGASPFSAASFAADIATHSITSASVTPRLLRDIVFAAPPEIAGLRHLTVGGDAIDSAVATAMRRNYPDLELYFTYGVSEAGPRVTTLAAHAVDSALLSALGEPLAGTELTIMPDAGSDDTGELLIRSDTLLVRKIGRNATDPTIDIAGSRWLRTGDIVRRDNRGNLFFENRRSDFVFVSGEKVNLRAIRSFCLQMPGVLQARTRTAPLTTSGYSLELELSATAASPTVEQVRRDVLDGLRAHERPALITVSRVADADAVVVK